MTTDQLPAWAVRGDPTFIVNDDGEILDDEVVDGRALCDPPAATERVYSPAGATCVHADGTQHDLEVDADGMFTACEVDERDVVPATLWQTSGRAVALFRDADAVLDLSRRVKAGLLEHVRRLAAEGKAARRPGPVTSSIVAAELSLLADAHDTLEALSRAIGDGAKEAKAAAGEVALEVAPDKRVGSTSVRVGGSSSDLKVTRTQPTKARVEEDDVVDVLAAYLVGHSGVEDSANPHGAYARGVRDGIARLRNLVGPLAWKTTALDELVRTLEAAEEDDLAIRLGHAFGRVSSGNPTVKIERLERKGGES